MDVRAFRGRPNREQQFEMLYRESVDEVYRFVLFRVADVEAARDITSEAFLRAAKHFHSYDRTRAKFSTWVMTIARNCAIDYFRSKKNTVPIDELVELRLASDGEDQNRVADADLAVRLLAVLDEEDREIIRLKFYEDLSNKDIARHMGMNVSTVSTRVQRALAKMRAAVRD